jgi:hypothetical protein
VAAAMIDRLVHHAEVIALKGDSYRLKDRNLGRVPAAAAAPTNHEPEDGQHSVAANGQYSAAVDSSQPLDPPNDVVTI